MWENIVLFLNENVNLINKSSDCSWHEEVSALVQIVATPRGNDSQVSTPARAQFLI